MAAPDRQAGQQGHTRAARDERLTGGDLVDLEGNLGLEAGGAASGQDELVAEVALCRIDPNVAGELAQTHLLAARQGMLLGEDCRVAVLEHGRELELLAQCAGGRLDVVHDRQVQLAALQARARFLGLHLHDVQLDLGMARVEGLDGRGHQGRPRALEGRQAQAPGARLEVCGQVTLGVGDAAQDRVGVGEQDLAGLGRARPLAVAFDQHGPRLALERGDLLADRRLRVGERIRRGGEGAALRQLSKDRQPLGI